MMNKTIKTVFWGTSEFAATILKNLLESTYRQNFIVTQPDRPQGRKQIIIPSPVKKVGRENNSKIFQPAILKNNDDFYQEIKKIEPDLFIVASYGMILPSDLLKIPKYGSINVHPSLLPKYRGPSPIQSAILNGDKETGVSLMLMDEKMDAGPVLVQHLMPIPKDITYPKLSEKLAIAGADLLIKKLPLWLNKKINSRVQNEAEATYTHLIKKEDSLIDIYDSAEKIRKKILAFQPWPGAYYFVNLPRKNISSIRAGGANGKIMLKIIEADIMSDTNHLAAGSFFITDEKLPALKCGQGALILKRLQPENKKIMTGEEFLNGYRLNLKLKAQS